MYGGIATSIPAGDYGTFATIRRMRELARSGAVVPLVRQTAINIVGSAAGTDALLQARLIRDWIEQRTLYLPDPNGAELLHEPSALVAHIHRDGIAHIDCDDVATLTAALGLAIGLRSRFVVVGFSPDGPFRHIWAELGSPYKSLWLPVDPTRAMQPLSGLTIRRSRIVEV